MTRPTRSALLLDGTGDLPRAFRPTTKAVPTQTAEEQPIDPLEQAFADGRAAGLAEARLEAQAAFEREAAALREETVRALEQLAGVERRCSRDYRQLMIELALEAATRIVREKVEAGDPIAARALADAVAALPGGVKLSARVSPQEIQAIRDGLAELNVSDNVELTADASVARGGCIVESQAGSIDATLDSALRAVRAAASGGAEIR